jgi:hypothetical protein
MRSILIILVMMALPISIAAADPPAPQKPARIMLPSATSDKTLPVKQRSSHANTCSAYGPDFVKVDGSDTCVKLGGAISVGVSSGR